MNKHFETKRIPFAVRLIDAGGVAHCIAKTSDERGDRALCAASDFRLSSSMNRTERTGARSDARCADACVGLWERVCSLIT